MNQNDSSFQILDFSVKKSSSYLWKLGIKAAAEVSKQASFSGGW